jgi:hypothetical protein
VLLLEWLEELKWATEEEPLQEGDDVVALLEREDDEVAECAVNEELKFAALVALECAANEDSKL